ncbi:hypothetical protein [Oceaniglobus trochenteri]|uniref:hypothetical protein n=1 Tax=Oceaniglobus trochenteri TaxID=2763260 RepID=UPI001D001A0F|nr:hypothetical protein [Oceaniglobus trochenteri]
MRTAPRFLQGGATLPRPVLWALAGLSLCAGVLGFSTGQRVSELTETDVIAAYAQIYAQETGGDVSDCVAMPGRDPVWLIVRCTGAQGARVFQVGHDGGLIARRDGKSA